MKKLFLVLACLCMFGVLVSAQDGGPQEDPYDPHPEEAHCDNTFQPAAPEHSCNCAKAAYCPPQMVPGADPPPAMDPGSQCRHYCRPDKCSCSGMCES